MCATRAIIAYELTLKSRRKICLYFYSLVVRLVVDSYVYSYGSQPDVYGEIVKAILSALGHRGVGKQIQQEKRGWLKKHKRRWGKVLGSCEKK
jgi:hypothetical protein